MTPFAFTPQSAEARRERVLRPVGPANGAAGVSPVPYDLLPEGAVDGTAVVYASATPPANPAQVRRVLLKLAVLALRVRDERRAPTSSPPPDGFGFHHTTSQAQNREAVVVDLGWGHCRCIWRSWSWPRGARRRRS